jgi:osmotically inducible protein OsmC
MLVTRSATVYWSGTGTAGHGSISTDSTVLNQAQYSYLTRFAEGVGTNPEELIAAAHTGCFSMKLAFGLQVAGIKPVSINTRCEVMLTDATITGSHLSVEADIPGLPQAQFRTLIEDARENCLVSKLLTVPITCSAALRVSDEQAL